MSHLGAGSEEEVAMATIRSRRIVNTGTIFGSIDVSMGGLRRGWLSAWRRSPGWRDRDLIGQGPCLRRGLVAPRSEPGHAPRDMPSPGLPIASILTIGSAKSEVSWCSTSLHRRQGGEADPAAPPWVPPAPTPPGSATTLIAGGVPVPGERIVHRSWGGPRGASDLS